MSWKKATTASVTSPLVVVILIFVLVTFCLHMEGLESEALHVKSSSKATAATRRDLLSHGVAVTITATGTCTVLGVWNGSSSAVVPVSGQTVSSLTSLGDPWIGTNLPLLSLEQAVDQSPSTNITWTMGRWPDPILRRPAEPIDEKWFTSQTLQQAAKSLKFTADQNGAHGLAAQQCGVNARMVYLSPQTTNPTTEDADIPNVGTILVNPYIVARSPEADMRVWVEECLVLPSSFRATVLRDDWIDVQYHSPDGQQHVERFQGEASRCLQHEMDHDRGILITDHVTLDELPDTVKETKRLLNMREIEANGHHQRMVQAYTRFVDTPPHTTKLG
jgi:peptide deformylase